MTIAAFNVGKPSLQKNDINKHKQIEHNNPFNGVGTEPTQLIERQKCHQCHYQTNTKTELEFHMNTVHQQLVKKRGVCKFYRQGGVTDSCAP